MPKYIFLDDERMPGDVTWVHLPVLPAGEKWHVVRSFEEFQQAVMAGDTVEKVCFDHDLGTLKTGMHCARWFCDYIRCWDKPIPEYVVHSMNPIGAISIDWEFKDLIRQIKGRTP